MKIYNNYNYAKCVEKLENGEATNFTYRKNNDFVSFNFIKRDLSYIFADLEKEKYFDITSPFDYGGFEYSNKEILSTFFEQFKLYCEKKNIISNFIRFTPTYKFDYEIISQNMDIKKINNLIYIDLEIDFWNNYSRGRKSNINKIKKLNYEIKNINISDFYTLYKDTMRRNKANSYFYFDIDILKSLIQEHFARVFGIYIDGILISSIMILDEDECSYYFLGASLTSCLNLDANAMLFHKIALKLKEEKQKKFFLGGGRQGVYDFKQRFSKESLPYYIGMKIYNKEIYEYFVKNSHNESNDFFPKYREKTI